jgi:hypothetical protein
MLFICVFLGRPAFVFLINFRKTVTRSSPKGHRKLPKSGMSTLSKHLVFTVRITHSVVSAVLWERIFLTLISGHCFWKLFLNFLDLGSQKGTQNVRLFRGGNVWKTTPLLKSSPATPRTAKELQNDTQMFPKRPKMMAKQCPNVSPVSRHAGPALAKHTRNIIFCAYPVTPARHKKRTSPTQRPLLCTMASTHPHVTPHT